MRKRKGERVRKRKAGREGHKEKETEAPDADARERERKERVVKETASAPIVNFEADTADHTFVAVLSTQRVYALGGM